MRRAITGIAVRRDDSQQLIGSEWLGDHFIDAQFERDPGCVVCAADEDERNGGDRRESELFSSQFRPIHHRHVQINEQQARWLLLQEGERLAPVAGHPHVVPLGVEPGRDECARRWIVFDQHDRLRSSHTLSSEQLCGHEQYGQLKAMVRQAGRETPFVSRVGGEVFSLHKNAGRGSCFENGANAVPRSATPTHLLQPCGVPAAHRSIAIPHDGLGDSLPHTANPVTHAACFSSSSSLGPRMTCQC